MLHSGNRLFKLVGNAGSPLSASATLISQNGSLVDKNQDLINVRAGKFTASAKDDIDLDTEVAELTATTAAAGTGSIKIDEKDSITLKSLEAGNGDVTVVAGGDITVHSLKASDAVTAPSDTRLVGQVALTAKGTASA